MSIQQRRLDIGWAQEELALHSGLSVRTVQRIEAGKKASLESLKCLAAVFETTVSELVKEQDMANPKNPDNKALKAAEENAIAFVQNVRAFHMNWMTFVIIMPLLTILNFFLSPQFWWAAIVAGAWGASIILHMIVINKLFSSDWEQREFLKRLNIYE